MPTAGVPTPDPTRALSPLHSSGVAPGGPLQPGPREHPDHENDRLLDPALQLARRSSQCRQAGSRYLAAGSSPARATGGLGPLSDELRKTVPGAIPRGPRPFLVARNQDPLRAAR